MTSNQEMWPRRSGLVNSIKDTFSPETLVRDIAAGIDEYGGELSESTGADQITGATSLDEFWQLSDDVNAQRVEAQVHIDKRSVVQDEDGETVLWGWWRHGVQIQAVAPAGELVVFAHDFGIKLGGRNAGHPERGDLGTLRTYLSAGKVLFDAKDRLQHVTTQLTSTYFGVGITQDVYEQLLYSGLKYRHSPWSSLEYGDDDPNPQGRR
jgi:hypothetical protein